MSIFITQEQKEAWETEIKQPETFQQMAFDSRHTQDHIIDCSDIECFYIGERGGRINTLKKLLANAVVLSKEEDWDNLSKVDPYNRDKSYFQQIKELYPQGVIIKK